MKLIDKVYGDISVYENFIKLYNEHLKSFGVHLPKENSCEWFKLKYFIEHYQEVVLSNDVLKFVENNCGQLKGADIAIRSLWKYGYNIVSGGKMNGVTPLGQKLKQAEYCLIDLYAPKPNFEIIKEHRITAKLPTSIWEEIKNKHNHKCATCGAVEGEMHPILQALTVLEQGHMDPNKPLSKDNCIPQCQFCNGSNMNNVKFSPSGAVLALNNTKIFDNSDLSVKMDCIKKFAKENPSEFRKIIEGL